jgi:hypothetical protein
MWLYAVEGGTARRGLSRIDVSMDPLATLVWSTAMATEQLHSHGKARLGSTINSNMTWLRSGR